MKFPSFSYRFSDLPHLLDGSFTAVVNNAKVDKCKLEVAVPASGSSDGGDCSSGVNEEKIYLLGKQESHLIEDPDAEGFFVISGDSLDRIPQHVALPLAHTAGHRVEMEVGGWV